MKVQTLQHFQTDGETWDKRAEKGKLPAVIDPGDLKGRKNLYIDILQKLAIQKALGREKARFIVDFGCGSGRFSALLAQRCEFLVGVEITRSMLPLAKEECNFSNVGFVLFDGLNLPIKEGGADIMVSINVLQYITDDFELNKILSELNRSLKSEGKLLCIEQVTRNKKRWQRDHQTYLHFFEQNGFQKVTDNPIRKGHFLWLYPIYFGLVPKRFLKTMAKFEMFLRKILWHSAWDYQDHLFVMKKT
jgi:ubiquinone/menaquinone biosynthesis C-methylase UbiE